MAVLSDRYELGRAVGNGGMGDVYEAYDQKLSRRVAVKCLKPGFTGSHHERFVREVRHAAAFIHPNVVTVFDVGDDQGSPYFVMELVDGHTLAAELEERGPLPPEEAVRIADAVLAGLSAAHARDLVHRDVKPANVLLGADGCVKLADFGIAKAVHDAATGLTAVNDIIGTPTYLSPEQASGDPTGPATDLYAVGVLLYEMLAGAPPFRGDTPMATAIAHREAPVPPLARQASGRAEPLGARHRARAREGPGLPLRRCRRDAGGARGRDHRRGRPRRRADRGVDDADHHEHPGPAGAPCPHRRARPDQPPPRCRPGPSAGRSRDRRRRLVPALVALVLVAALGTGVASALGGGGGPTSATRPSSASRPSRHRSDAAVDDRHDGPHAALDRRAVHGARGQPDRVREPGSRAPRATRPGRHRPGRRRRRGTPAERADPGLDVDRPARSRGREPDDPAARPVPRRLAVR